MTKKSWIIWLDEIKAKDIPSVGGKNAALGEMIFSLKKEKIAVPNGFATTSYAFFTFLKHNQLDQKIDKLLKDYYKSRKDLASCGKKIRSLIRKGKFPTPFLEELQRYYQNLSKKYKTENVDVAVRSSATAEDLPTASFAGQQETFLHIQSFSALVTACKKCYASLYTDRAISYRKEKGFEKKKIALSIGIQKMVRSDKASSGVLFTLDPETGFDNVICIDSAWGLGENIVQGNIIPDEFLIFKPHLISKRGYPILEKKLGSKRKKMIYTTKGKTKNVATTEKERKSYTLAEDEIIQLAKWSIAIEKHFKKAMDIEWAKDGLTNQLFIVQARPETVQSVKKERYTSFHLKEKGKILCEGLAIGESIAVAPAQVIQNVKEISSFKEGNILVTKMTSPDWVPIMKQAKGIITDQGGRTSHAAIVSRELGIPAIVGTQNATTKIKKEDKITLCCSEGDVGHVYKGYLDYSERVIPITKSISLPTNIMLNIASPTEAFRWWRLPAKGIGLARMEFIISNLIQIHPMALVHFNTLKDQKVIKKIKDLTEGYQIKSDYFVAKLSKNIAKIAASQYPHPVIVRMSDFKSNEYANLIGGDLFEEKEDNPMIGFRGASRYYDERYKEGFALECQAIKVAREFWGFDNLVVMIPFCRTIKEAKEIIKVLNVHGLKQRKKGLKIYMMAEIPSNVILAEEFAKYFDGFSIGSNDLTQLTLGIDRDSQTLAHLFDEKDPAILGSIKELIQKAHKNKTPVGICGEAPSNYPEFAKFLIDQKIDSISLSPNSLVHILEYLKKKKR